MPTEEARQVTDQPVVRHLGGVRTAVAWKAHILFADFQLSKKNTPFKPNETQL